MKDILNRLFEHHALTKEEAKEILIQITDGGVYSPEQIAAFLTVYNMRSITVAELSGFREVMLERCRAIDLSEFDPIDLCGTGGDRKDTFNISTLASFVVAGTGAKVAKHGNYGVSSVSGSSNVIEHFGYTFTNDEDQIRRSIDKANICFLHAPLFHPAMKHVAPIRRSMGVKTFFNMLGPMVNPCFPKRQIVGVFSLELARLYYYLYQQTDKRFMILHALDGYDEISLTGETKYLSDSGEGIVGPESLQLRQVAASEIIGGKSVPEAADIFKTILNYEGTEAQHSVVIANAAMALRCIHPEKESDALVAMARESLASGKAKKSFETFLNPN